jgi:hypothetical protein
VGHALLTRVESEVRARRGRLLLVETSATSVYALARHLYEKSGYRCEAVIHNFYAPGDDLMVYAKNVTADQIGQEAAETCQSVTADVSVEVPIWPKQVTGCRPVGERFGSLCAR